MQGAPWSIEAPWRWKTYPGVNDNGFIASEENLLAAWEHRLQVEKEAKLDTGDAEVLGDDVADSPIKRQRALIAHYMSRHDALDVTHTLATPCSSCAWKLEKSPTKNPDVPHCEWARRSRGVEFFVRVPDGIGPVVPMCRQYKPMALSWDRDQAGDYFRGLISESNEAISDELAAILLDHSSRLLYDGHKHLFSYGGKTNAGRTMLECFTGRPLKKSESHSSWILSWMNDYGEFFTPAQVLALFKMVRLQWKRVRGGSWRREYELLVGGKALPYQDQLWTTYWAGLHARN